MGVNGMSEDEALAAAMAASLATSGGEGGGAAGGLSQEEEDLALARALQESEATARRQGMAGGQQGQGVGQGDKNCSLQNLFEDSVILEVHTEHPTKDTESLFMLFQ